METTNRDPPPVQPQSSTDITQSALSQLTSSLPNSSPDTSPYHDSSVPSADEDEPSEYKPSPAKKTRKSQAQTSRSRRCDKTMDESSLSRAITNTHDKCNVLVDDNAGLLINIKSMEKTMGQLWDSTDHSDWETPPLRSLEEYELPSHGYYKRKLGSRPTYPGPERDKWQRDYRAAKKSEMLPA